MIKRILLAIAIILPMSAFAQKFGVVDLEAVFQAMPESTTMKTSLSEASKKYEEEYQRLGEELNKLIAEFQTLSQDPNTPQAITERRLNDIQERKQKVDEFRATAEQNLNRLQEQLIAPIQQKISEAVKAVGADGQYTFIFPNDQGLLLYQGTTVEDVTAAVKAKLDLK